MTPAPPDAPPPDALDARISSAYATVATARRAFDEMVSALRAADGLTSNDRRAALDRAAALAGELVEAASAFWRLGMGLEQREDNPEPIHLLADIAENLYSIDGAERMGGQQAAMVASALSGRDLLDVAQVLMDLEVDAELKLPPPVRRDPASAASLATVEILSIVRTR
jgi:hypothetical protein